MPASWGTIKGFKTVITSYESFKFWMKKNQLMVLQGLILKPVFNQIYNYYSVLTENKIDNGNYFKTMIFTFSV